jgi:quinoprotein glucose dehydrogenase
MPNEVLPTRRLVLQALTFMVETAREITFLLIACWHSDARTGKRIWHYQLVHHDLWDLDLAAPPALVVVNHNGVQKEAVAQTSKMGFIYVLDRTTGESLFEIKEKPVPPSDVPGEQTAETQPFPVAPPPLVPQSMSEDNITNISKEAHQYILDTLRKMRYGSMYTPPSLQGTCLCPGLAWWCAVDRRKC